MFVRSTLFIGASKSDFSTFGRPFSIQECGYKAFLIFE